MKCSSICFWAREEQETTSPLTHWAPPVVPVEKYHLQASREKTNLNNRLEENETTVSEFPCAISGNYQKPLDEIYRVVVFLHYSQGNKSQWFIMIKMTLILAKAKEIPMASNTILKSHHHPRPLFWAQNGYPTPCLISQIFRRYCQLCMTQIRIPVFPPNPDAFQDLSDWDSHLSQWFSTLSAAF